MSVMIKNKTNKNYKRSQRGRSMVEMLGVLAIVGVLSVGGVYGYGVAMKKHKANELLHQASMLAATISAQAMSNDGKLPETITDFGSTSYGKFPTTVGETADKTGFTITIENVDSAVCDQLKKGGMVQNVDCNPDAKTATLTYYKNLATNEIEGKKSPTGGSAGTADPLCQDVKCESGQQCIGGVCAEVTACAGDCQNCYLDYEREEDICEDTIGCSKNADCDEWCKDNGDGEKCYCAINAVSTEDDSDFWENFTGVCAVARTESGVTGGYTASDNWLSWWSAVNFCKAHGKSLVSLADLGITGGYQDDAECEGSGCICGAEECTETFWSDLRSKIGETREFYWTTDAVSCDLNTMECTSGTNNNSWGAFILYLSDDVADPRSRNSTIFALCE